MNGDYHMKQFFLLALLFTGCISPAPVDLINEINSVSETKIIKNEELALKEIQETTVSAGPKTELNFNKEDRLVLINGKRAPTKVLSLKIDGDPFLVISSVIKSAGWRKDTLVVPQIKFYKDKVLQKQPKIKQIGIDGLCGLDACSVTTYDLSNLVKGNYKILVSAYVEKPDVPLEMRKVEGTYAAGASLVYTSAERAQLASYYGLVKVMLSKELPLNSNRKDVKNF